MRSVLASMASLLMFALGWIVTALTFALIGFIVSHARSDAGLLQVIHLILMWVLSPAIGGFFAVYLTGTLFGSVARDTIYVSFTSVIAAFVAITFIIYILGSFHSGAFSIGETILFVFQATAVFLGARIGKACMNDDVRPVI
jgi:hypothetical protein